MEKRKRSVLQCQNLYDNAILGLLFKLIGPLIIGIIYAVIITIPIEKVEKEQLAKELERQIKKEQGYR